MASDVETRAPFPFQLQSGAAARCVPSVPLAERPVLAIVFGWTGGTHRQLERFAGLHRELQQASTLLVSSTFFESLHSYRVRDDVGRAILEYLDSVFEAPPRVICHVLSNGGLVKYLGFQSMLSAPQFKRWASAVQGIVFDSTPAQSTLGNYSLVLSTVFASRIVRVIARHVILLLLCVVFGIRGALWACCCGPCALRRRTRRNAWAGYHDGQPLLFEPPSGMELAPLLFLYSKADAITKWTFVQRTVEHLKALKRDAREVVFEGSSHVAHFKTYASEYTKALESFLDYALVPAEDRRDWNTIDRKLLAKARKASSVPQSEGARAPRNRDDEDA